MDESNGNSFAIVPPDATGNNHEPALFTYMSPGLSKG
jgi:hypothetical protein